MLVAVAAALAALPVGWQQLTGDTTRATSPSPGAGAATPRAHVALQVGHWRAEELPEEQHLVRDAAGGTTAAGVVEWEVNLAIAREAARLLAARNIATDVLPAKVSPRYRADAFVSIHADGNEDASVSGFKSVASARDRSGRADLLNGFLGDRYAQATGLRTNPTVTPDMTGYYAFDARRFRYAIDPRTPAVVLETGFLSNPEDRDVIVRRPELAAAGIARGVLDFLAA